MLREEESARHCRGRGSFFCLDRKTQRTKNAEFSRWRNKCVTGTVTSHLPRHLDGAFYDCSVSGTSTAPPAGFPSHSFASSRAQPLSTISVNPIVNKLRDKGRQINKTPAGMLLNSSATTFGHETVNSGTFFPSLLHFSIVLFLARSNQR